MGRRGLNFACKSTQAMRGRVRPRSVCRLWVARRGSELRYSWTRSEQVSSRLNTKLLGAHQTCFSHGVHANLAWSSRGDHIVISLQVDSPSPSQLHTGLFLWIRALCDLGTFMKHMTSCISPVLTSVTYILRIDAVPQPI